MDVREVIGDNVRRARRSQGIEYERFAELMTDAGVEMSGATVLRLETGKRGVKVDELLALSYVLGVNPLGLAFPADGSPVDVTESIIVTPQELTDWWLGREHPREDVQPEPVPTDAREMREMRALVRDLGAKVRVLTDQVGLLLTKERLRGQPELEGNDDFEIVTREEQTNA